MTMGLCRFDNANWLTVTPNYMPEHALRTKLLATQKSNVLQCLPGSEDACHEVLSVVSTFLLARYPSIFTVSRSASTSPIIHNALTSESFQLGADNLHPLETAARLAMEDFNILVRSDDSGEYELLASATLFPAGWKLQERIGSPLSGLHGPVPNWAAKLICPVTRYLDHLTPQTAMERHPLFVQTDERLFCPEPLPPSDVAAAKIILRPEDIQIRRERQTFVPLQSTLTSRPGQKRGIKARSGEKQHIGPKMVLFSVHTYLTPMIKLCDDDLDALVRTVRSWPEVVAAYKGREAWLDVVLQYQEARCGGNSGGHMNEL